MARRSPEPSSDEARRRMQAVRRRDTELEMRMRSRLHALGYRYLVDASPFPGTRRRADLIFRTERLAVFVDSCFWHGCPQHGTWPKANAAWWREKLEANQARDRATDELLKSRGWIPLRVWEHEALDAAIARVVDAVRQARRDR